LRSKQRASLPVLADEQDFGHGNSIFRIQAGIEERLKAKG
jgi:hypothetical protein